MGTSCCTSHTISAEEFINFVLLETNLPKCEFHTIESRILHVAEDDKINKNVFDDKIMHLLFNCNKNVNKYYTYHDNIFEDILVIDDMNKGSVFQTLLALYSFIGHGHKDVLYNFYNLVTKSQTADKDAQQRPINLKYLKKCVKTYLEINLVVITNSVYNTLVSCDGNECEKIDFKHLVDKVFTPENVEKYYKSLFQDLLHKNNPLREINEEDFIDFFREKEHLFSFWTLRADFMQFYMDFNNPYNSYNSNQTATGD